MLCDPVLVLNASYEPMVVCSVRRAIVLVYLGKAKLVERRDGHKIRSVSMAVSEPSVVRLDHYVKVPFKQVMLNRRNVIRRDRSSCQYCGTTSRPMTVDHVVPRQHGGRDVWENLVCACDRCNNKKGGRKLEEAGMTLIRQPTKPTYLTFMRQLTRKSDQAWQKYLFGN